MTATEERMKEVLKGRLLPGKKVKIEWYVKRDSGRAKCVQRKSGYVIALYPHIFTVKMENNIESFRYSQLFEKGAEIVRLA